MIKEATRSQNTIIASMNEVKNYGWHKQLFETREITFFFYDNFSDPLSRPYSHGR